MNPNTLSEDGEFDGIPFATESGQRYRLGHPPAVGRIVGTFPGGRGEALKRLGGAQIADSERLLVWLPVIRCAHVRRCERQEQFSSLGHRPVDYTRLPNHVCSRCRREPLIGTQSENTDDHRLERTKRLSQVHVIQADVSARHATAQPGRPPRSRNLRTVRGEDVALDSSSCGRTRGDCRRSRQRWLRSSREQSTCGRRVDLRRWRQR